MEKPECLGTPEEVFVMHPGRKVHNYFMPESGPDIIEAIEWMMGVYDDVHFDYGESWGSPYAYLVGYVRSPNGPDVRHRPEK